MQIKFTKMHGLGNDFMVIDGIDQSIHPKDLNIPKLSHRHIGVGFDQLLLIEKSQLANYSCRIFNADGSEVSQCGNGLRCVALYIHDKYKTGTEFEIETKAGIFPVKIEGQLVKINMGKPIFEPRRIPLTANLKKAYTLAIAEKTYEMSVLSMGNPHAILEVKSLSEFPVSTLGALIEKHEAFPQGTNVGFMEVTSRQSIKLRTFERGVGETLACGSNACAAVVAGILNNKLDTSTKVQLCHGEILVEWKDQSHSVFMTGPATYIHESVLLSPS